MKDFRIRNDTKLLFRNDPLEDLTNLTKGKKVLFVYGSGSVHKNGCYDDIKNAVSNGKGQFYELGNASRELSEIERGIKITHEKNIDLVIGAGGASIMDASKMIAFGHLHSGYWEYAKGRKNPYGESHLPLILMPTYPSSGSEFGMGAVVVDSRTNDFGTAYGITANYAFLVPKYSLTLSPEMTAYTGLVTLVQLCSSVLGDKNPVSYDQGISVIKNVLKATQNLRENPHDITSRGVILYGASISTSGWLGIGKVENYSYDIYEVEFVPEVLFNATYRKSLTTIYPRFLKVMAKYHENDIRTFLNDAFGYSGTVEESANKLIKLFTDLGIDMHFEGEYSEDKLDKIPIQSMLKKDEILSIIKDSMK